LGGMPAEHQAPLDGKRSLVPAAILVVVIAYGIALCFGLPQAGTRFVVENHAPHTAASVAAAPNTSHEVAAPPFWTVLPFVFLLAAIALLPLIPRTARWWESNLNRFKVAGGLALLTIAYYAFLHSGAIEGHWPAHHIVARSEGRVQAAFVNAIFANAMLGEFVPFIVLLFSLYTISGGIRIACDFEARPITNAIFMGIGAVLASLIGTTGAAMLLVRPLLETNKQRKHVAHTVVLFIFIVCNCGGCLLPIGDPPLFLGYLEGVPFLWTLRLWPEWLFVNGLLILIYFTLDGLWFHPRETKRDLDRDVHVFHRVRIAGSQLHAPLLIGVVLAVVLLDPSKPFPGTNWHPWMYLREVAELGLVGLSLRFGSRAVRDANLFTYGAIVEVAALFVGIFICMQPALQILSINGSELGLSTAPHFFWASGSLSSVLDNAPTYLVFFKTAQSLSTFAHPDSAGVDATILMAISLGSVFMGAMTYIGNGPNFMVRGIAESSGVKMPSFFGYLIYSFAILLPILALAVWQFLM
jgi:Na+/H+ antiporter NhaD/arsenite permease-like protein